MQLISQGNQQKCIIYSLAMLLDLDVKDVEEALPQVSERSHHIQEVIDYLWPTHTLLHIEPNPAVDNIENLVFNDPTTRFLSYALDNPGLIICAHPWHCVAWDGHKIYDPNGVITDIGNPRYIIMSYYMLLVI